MAKSTARAASTARCRPEPARLWCAAMSRAGMVGLLLILGVVAYVLAGSMQVSAHRCEVCMEYRGHSKCRTVEAATIELAREGAMHNACAFISGGVTDSMACQRGTPVRENCQ